MLVHLIPPLADKEAIGLLLIEDPTHAFFDIGLIGPFARHMPCREKCHDGERSNGGMLDPGRLPGAVLLLQEREKRQAALDAVVEAILGRRLRKRGGSEETGQQGDEDAVKQGGNPANALAA